MLEVVDRWLDPACRYFKVLAHDGRKYVLRHDTVSGDWELTALVGLDPGSAGGGQTPRH